MTVRTIETIRADIEAVVVAIRDLPPGVETAAQYEALLDRGSDLESELYAARVAAGEVAPSYDRFL